MRLQFNDDTTAQVKRHDQTEMYIVNIIRRVVETFTPPTDFMKGTTLICHLDLRKMNFRDSNLLIKSERLTYFNLLYIIFTENYKIKSSMIKKK